MIQFRKIRQFTPRGSKKPKKYDAPFKPDITVANIMELIDKSKEIIDSLESKENIYYTLGHVPGETPEQRVERQWLKQEVIPFDIDDIDPNEMQRTSEVVCEALNIEWTKTFVHFTGHGLQLLIMPKHEITDQEYFKKNLIYYKAICGKVNARLQASGLRGVADTSAFAPNRLFRLPNSINAKPGLKPVETKVLNSTIEPIDWNLQTASGLPLVKDSDQVTKKQLRYFKIDKDAVLSGCEFIKSCKAHPERVSEPQWYALLSLFSPMQGALDLAIEYSKGHPDFDADETRAKLEQAEQSSGPRTCENICSMFDCETCENYKQVNSPVSIRGEDFIATRETGFHLMDAKGNLHPQYDDLRKYYLEQNHYINVNTSHFSYNGMHYTEVTDPQVDAFAQDNFRPTAKNTMANEFRGIVKRTNVFDNDFFTTTTDRKVNLLNGVLDLDTLELSEHSPQYGFRSVLPFNYDSEAIAPSFSQHLDAVSCGDATLRANLLEFMGYAISNDKPRAQKILVMAGDGQNGKSTTLEILKAIGGDGVTALNVKDLGNPFHRQALDGALFNILEEVPEFTHKDFWEDMKGLATGSRVIASKKFKDAYSFDNRCKFIMTCNELPKGATPNHGFFRRLLIIPYNARFSGSNDDKFLADRIINDELPGVLNMILEAYARLRANRFEFTASKAIDQAVSAYREESDNVARWLSENLAASDCGASNQDMPKDAPAWLVQASTGHVGASVEEMHKQYQIDAQEQGERSCALRTFGRRLKYWLKVSEVQDSRFSKVDHKRVTISGRKLRLIFGLTWKSDAEC